MKWGEWASNSPAAGHRAAFEGAVDPAPQPPSPAPQVAAAALPRRNGRSAPSVWDLTQRIVAFLILVILLPVMVVIALLVVLEDGGPILFTHRRIGQHGKAFGCLKFRTMGVDAQERLTALLSRSVAARAEWAREQKLHDDPRVTWTGRLLRKTSLDELPQLINVLRGEMNLVGPRPIVESEIPRYRSRFRNYCAVKPGITGLWQISGRNDVSYNTRVALDTLYSHRRAPGLDLWILLLTVPAVLLRRGSY
jgi:exopolysaccharide production protein ExoY